MRQFKTDLFQNEPPFACCLFHKEIKPEDESFLEMLRLTFFPLFQLYSFTFFWLGTITFVFIYSLAVAPVTHLPSFSHSQFLSVSQKALFMLGENYPYYLVMKGDYYRLLTSTVLFRSLYHFFISAIGILSFGSYVEQIVGFKRILLLSISTGVGGEIIRNIFVFDASIESLTPICGLIGFLFGYYIVKSKTKWKYCQKEKMHMLIVMILMMVLYIQLGVEYRNISLESMLAAFLLGFVFYFCDPDDDRYETTRLWVIIFLTGVIGISVVILFFKTNPPLVTL